ncbi:Pre-rRNA-processing protein TSR2 [Zancudomyces culisetae]|uniref:Pre-rRNA-processing protein TSR2 n=1 Tax=Zancudomyces culisetae TaxID=1213189 RepID=A0A1R1PZB9_ZANCU|nr:Pre-rRNA-processing protein TSR2 [Zancudomyces culisetae]|eukprot:OMH86285.1 Pre-rRNA-processing protein TSR2 [Zancudomyces culisetae]
MHPNKQAFVEGVDHVFTKWTALALAVKQEWGGPDSVAKRDWMVDAVVQEFDTKGTKIDQEYIEDLLLQIMEDEFECNIEDGSERDVSALILQIYKQCIRGDFTLVDKLRSEIDSSSTPGQAESNAVNMSKGQESTVQPENDEESEGEDCEEGSNDDAESMDQD